MAKHVSSNHGREKRLRGRTEREEIQRVRGRTKKGEEKETERE